MKTILTCIGIIVCTLFPFATISQHTDETKNGVDTSATINSFAAFNDFYHMDYTGDYSLLLDWLDDQMTQKKDETFDPFECSLFSANGDAGNQLFGRNFDNPQNDVLLSRFNPPDAYKSIAFTRMSDLGFSYGTNYELLCFEEKIPLLYAAYFVPDGINEHGLSAGLATVDAVTYTIDPAKDTIFITRLIREILDHAATVEEAVEIANSYNVFDNGINVIMHHVLVGTPNETSVTLEFQNGEFQAVFPDNNWQVLTNTPVYNIPHQQLMNTCWRYNKLFTIMEENVGMVSWQIGMDALDQVHLNCPWSAIYDMTNKAIYVAVHNNFNDIHWVDLANFEFMTIVDVPEYAFRNTEKLQLYSFPNPFSEGTRLHYTLPEESQVTVRLYNLNGKIVNILADNEWQQGEQILCWDGLHSDGYKVQPGVYVGLLDYNGRSAAIRLVLTD